MKKRFTCGDNQGYPCYFGFGSKTLIPTVTDDDMLNIHIGVLRERDKYKVGEEIPNFTVKDLSHLWGTMAFKDPDSLRAIIKELNKSLDWWEEELTKSKQYADHFRNPTKKEEIK